MLPHEISMSEASLSNDLLLECMVSPELLRCSRNKHVGMKRVCDLVEQYRYGIFTHENRKKEHFVLFRQCFAD